MSKKEKLKIIHDKSIIIIFSVVLFIIIVFGSLNLMIFNKDFYYREYSKNNVYFKLTENTGVTRDVAVDTITNATENTVNYLRGSEKELTHFTDAEKSHMSDVKHLINVMHIVYYSAAILCILLFFYTYQKFKNDKFMFTKILTKALLYSSISTIIFLIVIFLLCVFYFELVFTIFHMIFFPQGNWMFDSSSLLITMFPEQFFFDISLRIFIYAIFQALIFFGIGYWLNKQLKIIEKHHPKV
jgi:integral membrane protein (TIGR01906 family)